MSDFNWKGLLTNVAPALATAFGSPLAGMAVKAASLALLGNEDGTEADIEMALANATPDDLLKLKTANHEFETKMAELGIDAKKIAADDRDSARKREIETKDNAPKVLAAVIVIGFFATLATVAFATIPDKAMPAINILLGSLTALLIQVGNYYFGSSAGSKQKTALIGKMTA